MIVPAVPGTCLRERTTGWRSARQGLDFIQPAWGQQPMEQHRITISLSLLRAVLVVLVIVAIFWWQVMQNAQRHSAHPATAVLPEHHTNDVS